MDGGLNRKYKNLKNIIIYEKKNLFLLKEWPNVNFEENFEKTLEYINNTFKEKGPFDGVFGFSMGGSIHTLI